MLHEVVATDPGKVREGNRRSDMDENIAADLVVDFAEEQRQPQRQADMAGDLEEQTVLPRKEHRNDRRFGLQNQTRGEFLPFRIDGPTVPRLGRGGSAAGRKDNEASAID